LFYISFCSFTFLVCGEKNILPNLTNSQEPEPVFFGPLEPKPEPLGKKIPGTGAVAALEKIRSRSRLKKKSGAAKKLAGSPALPYILTFSVFYI